MRTPGWAITALLALIATMTDAQTIPVTRYTLRSSSTMKGTGETIEAWTAVVMHSASERGRMDIIDGASDDFAKSDYVLFESTDFIIVRPSTKQFFARTEVEMLEIDELATEIGEIAGTPKPGTVASTTVVADSLGPETIDGRPTQAWRLSQSTSTTVDAKTAPAGMELPSMAHSMVTQLWLADAPPMPQFPLGPSDAAVILSDDQVKQLSAESRAAMMRIPKGKLIVRSRMTMSSSWKGTPMPGYEIASANDISGIAKVNVTATLFDLPEDYVEIAQPHSDDAPRLPGKVQVDKWRTKKRAP